MSLGVDSIRECLEGTIPAMVATCSADGTPNVAYLSQVEYVDSGHVALSFQFFNKTRQNILVNPWVEILVIHPVTAAMYRVRARYLRTEEEGPLYERMKAKLAGIASHTGMAGVFRLLGSDIYAVQSIEPTGTRSLGEPSPGLNRLAALRRALAKLAAANDLELLLERLLDALALDFGIEHAIVLMVDASRERLYTVASRGYGASGVGSEIGFGQGVIGVAANARTPVRICHLTLDRTYSQAIREGVESSGNAAAIEREIAWPGLAEPHSQLAVPVCSGEDLLGVVFVESGQALRFTYDDEDALLGLATHLGVAMRQLQTSADTPDEVAALHKGASQPRGEPVRVRYFDADGSVFVGDEYLIKGVAGAILWKLLREHRQSGRVDFTNRELRLAGDIRLPDVSDNLEARLVLLTRRLAERGGCLSIEKTGRGRFRLIVERPLLLEAAGQRTPGATPPR
jgi:adenylate cyclase